MHCEQCHRPLAHAEDICPVCAVELSQSTEAIPDLSGTVGRHQCPGCHGKFDYCGTAWHPPHARWYVPQTAKTVCPLCAVELQWKRLQEPPQLSGALQGIALGLAWSLWSTIPPALNQWIKAQLGSWFVILTPLALFALLFLAIRPPLLNAGKGASHFVLATNSDSSRRKSQVLGIIFVLVLMGGYWATPQAHKLTVWAAGFGLAVMGCLLAVVWRIRTEQRLRRSAH